MSKVVRITSKTPCIYTLKIELAPKFLKPTIWRLIEVDGRASLAKLHHFIQAAFGWSDAHLHEYKFIVLVMVSLTLSSTMMTMKTTENLP